MMDLQVHQAERLLYVLRVFGGHLEQAAAVSPESAHRTDVFRWAEAGLQQSYRVQILNPLTVGHITLAAGTVFSECALTRYTLKPRSSRI